ncbi:MAG: HAD family phosphatase [Oscillospiraceae bacterium]|nr:HAD family phosphatase [Oscillospiraceae bacterium]
MHKDIKIIALDLDGTLLDSSKNLSPANLAALERAAKAGIEIVPTTGRFFGGMPQAIRNLPFVNYAITINGAQAQNLRTGEVIYKAEIPLAECLDIMTFLDSLPVIYDCYMDNAGWMTADFKKQIDGMVRDGHYRKMLHELRTDVPELKAFLRERGTDVQKTQFFMADMALREKLLNELEGMFPDICVSSSTEQNIEINASRANKGEALTALAHHLGYTDENTMSFGDGLNDLSMIKSAGLGVAMENACSEVKNAADYITDTNDNDGVKKAIEKFCFKEG